MNETQNGASRLLQSPFFLYSLLIYKIKFWGQNYDFFYKKKRIFKKQLNKNLTFDLFSFFASNFFWV